jgi:hypothetical protein
VAPEPISWLWHQRIALGKVTLVAGDPGLGKSLLGLAISAAVSKGASWPVDGGRAPLGDVILLSAEDDLADTIRPRLDAAGADVSRIHMLTMVRDVESRTGQVTRRGFSLRRDISILAAELAARPDCRLVGIDPISAYLDGTDSHTNSDVRCLMAPLAELAAKFRVAVLAISHLNKGGQASAMYRFTGSLAFVAAARAGYAVVKDKEDATRRLVLPVKNNLAPDGTGLAYRISTTLSGAPRIEWEPEPVTISADEAMARPREEEEGSTLDDAQEFLSGLLANGPLQVRQIRSDADGAGYAWRTIQRAQKALGVEARKLGMKDGWVWSLPAKSAKNTEERQPQSLASFDTVGALRDPGQVDEGVL